MAIDIKDIHVAPLSVLLFKANSLLEWFLTSAMRRNYNCLVGFVISTILQQVPSLYYYIKDLIFSLKECAICSLKTKIKQRAL